MNVYVLFISFRYIWCMCYL